MAKRRGERLDQWESEMRREGAMLGLGGLAVGALLGGVVGYAWGARRSEARHRPATNDRGAGAAGRLQGILSAIGVGEPADDRLASRVRAAIARAVADPGDLSVAAEAGRVTLAGSVRRRELEPLLRAAASVRGVREIENLLNVREPSRRQGLPGTH
jgi:hypothetical protein